MATRVSRGIALPFLDRGIRRGWVVNSTPQPHFTPGKDPVPIVHEAGWAPGPVRRGGRSRPTGIRSPDRPARSQSLYRLSYRAHNRFRPAFIKPRNKIQAMWVQTFRIYANKKRWFSVTVFRNLKICLVQYTSEYSKLYDIWNMLFQRCGFHMLCVIFFVWVLAVLVFLALWVLTVKLFSLGSPHSLLLLCHRVHCHSKVQCLQRRHSFV
jgi:hypothetical protein